MNMRSSLYLVLFYFFCCVSNVSSEESGDFLEGFLTAGYLNSNRELCPVSGPTLTFSDGYVAFKSDLLVLSQKLASNKKVSDRLLLKNLQSEKVERRYLSYLVLKARHKNVSTITFKPKSNPDSEVSKAAVLKFKALLSKSTLHEED